MIYIFNKNKRLENVIHDKNNDYKYNIILFKDSYKVHEWHNRYLIQRNLFIKPILSIISSIIYLISCCIFQNKICILTK